MFYLEKRVRKHIRLSPTKRRRAVRELFAFIPKFSPTLVFVVKE